MEGNEMCKQKLPNFYHYSHAVRSRLFALPISCRRRFECKRHRKRDRTWIGDLRLSASDGYHQSATENGRDGEEQSVGEAIPVVSSDDSIIVGSLAHELQCSRLWSQSFECWLQVRLPIRTIVNTDDCGRLWPMSTLPTQSPAQSPTQLELANQLTKSLTFTQTSSFSISSNGRHRMETLTFSSTPSTFISFSSELANSDAGRDYKGDSLQGRLSTRETLPNVRL